MINGKDFRYKVDIWNNKFEKKKQNNINGPIEIWILLK